MVLRTNQIRQIDFSQAVRSDWPALCFSRQAGIESQIRRRMRVPISVPQSYTFFSGFKTARELLRLDDVKAVWWPMRAVATEVPFLCLYVFSVLHWKLREFVRDARREVASRGLFCLGLSTNMPGKWLHRCRLDFIIAGCFCGVR
jgi:hypothetical protein